MGARASLEMLNGIQKLAETGRHAAVAEQLGALPVEELEQSPTLALLFGISQARVGRHELGKRWVTVGLEAARARSDQTIEARALNVLGAIAFEQGQVEEAFGYFTRGLAKAERLGDRGTVGRCSNNLGAIASLRGQYGRAVGSHTMALAAFQQVGHRTGVAETLQNLAMAYREQNDLATALETDERAVQEATAAGDLALAATIESGRAEIRLLAGDADVAMVGVQRALAVHRDLGDVAAEAEDLRVLAAAMVSLGELTKGEATLRDVIGRATKLNRPLLAAQAERDLARLLHDRQRDREAEDLARRARSRFETLGAVVEVRRLDELLTEIAS
ncbi:MAG: tetratricopeptide repeat protein [Gemmatimonadetes bacterium]|nr:tetratricopeptide repeat protein [Gemmatimonadota bacterium]